jgi:CHASE2 domain-containing sensor protein
MFTGLAGEEKLEILLRASFILWLLQLGTHSFMLSQLLRRNAGKTALVGKALSLVYLLVSLSILMASEHPWETLKSIILFLLTASVCVYMFVGLRKRITNPLK